MTKSVCATCSKAASSFTTPTLFDSRIDPYGSFHRVTGAETSCYQAYMDTLIPGPGNIDQAHTVGEWRCTRG